MGKEKNDSETPVVVFEKKEPELAKEVFNGDFHNERDNFDGEDDPHDHDMK